MPRAFNSDGEGALALRGKASLAAWLDLAALREEPAQAGNILVVNLVNAIGGEDVHAATTTGATTEPAATTATAAKSAAAAAAAKSATAAITTEPTTATATTVTTAIIGTGGAIITRCALIRCPLRALLVSHGLCLLLCIR